MDVLKDVPITALKEWSKNPRKNDQAVNKLKVLIEKYGYIDPIVVDQNNVIRAGHTRFKALQKLGRKTVPLVLKVKFASEEDAIGYAIADNKSMEWSAWDGETLKEILEELKDFDIGLSSEEITDMKKSALELEEIIDNGFLNYAQGITEQFTVSFTFDKKYQEQIKALLKAEGKEKIVDWIIKESEPYA